MLTGRKLLLADDSLTIQKVVSLTFGDEEMKVTTVSGGAEALEHLGESLPDIVLADVFMPEPNGYALCERIKRDERTRHIPVVLLVGTFEPFNEAEARRVGADEVLTKPFQSIRDLVNKVGGLLGGQGDEKRPDADARSERQAEETTRDLSPFAADARAAEPQSETPAPADAFADFDLDDATIQTTPAVTFDAQQQHTAVHSFSEIRDEEQFSDRGETTEAFVIGNDATVLSDDAVLGDNDSVLDDDDSLLSFDDAPAPETHAATTVAASTQAEAHASHAAASHTSSVPFAESAFDAHAPRAADADDGLLDIEDIAPARSASAEEDDFILDIGDEDAFDSAASTPDSPVLASAAAGDSAAAEADLFFAEHAPAAAAPQDSTVHGAFTEAESSATSHVSAHTSSYEEATEPTAEASSLASHAPDSFAEVEAAPHAEAQEELRAPEIADAPVLLFENEPVADGQEPTEPEGTKGTVHEPTWDGDPVAASIVAHAGGAAANVEALDDSPMAESSASHGSFVTAEATSPTDAPVFDSHAAPAASSQSAASSETNQVAASAATVEASSSESSKAASPATAAAALSPEMLDEVVRRVVAQMSEQVVREIAWEVVPELAERLIKQRLEEERTH
ncbi:MAG TPA: response regulator [Pyrinomonadaceae bacterium]|nr:response regulator [Pyrinomonadaceae bacterium]